MVIPITDLLSGAQQQCQFLYKRHIYDNHYKFQEKKVLLPPYENWKTITSCNNLKHVYTFEGVFRAGSRQSFQAITFTEQTRAADVVRADRTGSTMVPVAST